jgi:WD40 repeat protein
LVKRLDTSSGTVETIGEGECSLWALTKIGPEAYAACDYRGKLYTISDTVEKSSLQLSWARAMTTIGDGRVAVATQDGTVAIIDFAQEKVIVQRELHQSQVFEIRFDADKDELLTCDAGGNIIRSKVASLEPLASLSLGGESLWTAARVGELIVAGGSARTVEVADGQLSQRLLAVNSTSDWVSGSVHVGSSDLALLSTLGGTIEAFDIKKMHRISSTQVVESGIWDCKISPNGKTLAIATRKHGVQLVDVAPLISAAPKAATAAERLLPPQPK